MNNKILLIILLLFFSCSRSDKSDVLKPKISLVNSPTDILTYGANYLAEEIGKESNGTIKPKVFHSGILSGGKGQAEIEMCQQGSIEIHITSTAYMANMVPKASVVSLPFLFRDVDQVVGLAKSKSTALETINKELNKINLNILLTGFYYI